MRRAPEPVEVLVSVLEPEHRTRVDVAGTIELDGLGVEKHLSEANFTAVDVAVVSEPVTVSSRVDVDPVDEFTVSRYCQLIVDICQLRIHISSDPDLAAQGPE